MSERLRRVLLMFPTDGGPVTASEVGSRLDAAGLVVGGNPSNRCLPAASVLHALKRRGYVKQIEADDRGRRAWVITPEGLDADLFT